MHDSHSGTQGALSRLTGCWWEIVFGTSFLFSLFCGTNHHPMKAYIFPGQGSQFPGMAKDLYDGNPKAKQWLDQADSILGFKITDVMFSGTAEELKQTKITQPAIFLHSVVMALTNENFSPDMVAGHSLGEFSALVANKTLAFEDGLKLVYKRALAMQRACEINPSTMAAILGLEDEKVEEICASITEEIVVAANYNCPGQLVISGTMKGVEIACEKMKAAGAKRALLLPVGGAFHSPLMEPAREELAKAIDTTAFGRALCPVYQNVNASPSSDNSTIKANLIAQLTAPVRWTQSVQRMTKDGAKLYIECGPGKVLQGLVKKITPEVEVASL
jgi:[acyl-carrier-protein] S-malonyltransferase